MHLAGGFLGKASLAPPTFGLNPDFDRRLADDRLENEPLFLMMAGIVAAERGAPAALALGRIELAKEMAGIERGRLARFGASRGLPPDGDIVVQVQLTSHSSECSILRPQQDW